MQICRSQKSKAKMIMQVELQTIGWNWKYCKTKMRIIFNAYNNPVNQALLIAPHEGMKAESS